MIWEYPYFWKYPYPGCIFQFVLPTEMLPSAHHSLVSPESWKTASTWPLPNGRALANWATSTEFLPWNSLEKTVKEIPPNQQAFRKKTCLFVHELTKFWGSPHRFKLSELFLLVFFCKKPIARVFGRCSLHSPTRHLLQHIAPLLHEQCKDIKCQHVLFQQVRSKKKSTFSWNIDA